LYSNGLGSKREMNDREEIRSNFVPSNVRRSIYESVDVEHGYLT